MHQYPIVQVQVQVQIFGKEELPSLNEIIANIRAEESWRDGMVKDQVVEGSALAPREYKDNSAAKQIASLPVSKET